MSYKLSKIIFKNYYPEISNNSYEKELKKKKNYLDYIN